MAGDGARLDHRRIRGNPRRFRLPTGLHRRRAVVRRFRHRGIPRNSPGSSTAQRGLVLAIRARARPVRRAAGRGDPRERHGGPRLQGPPRADRSRDRRARRPARGRARSGARARRRVDRRRRRRPGPQSEHAARGHPALGDPAGAERPAAALGPDPQRARAPGPAAVDRRAVARRLRAAAAHRARTRRQSRIAQRRACARHRLRAGDRGLGVGRRARSDRHERARGRRRERHDGAGARAARRACPRARSPSTRPTTSPCSASPTSACRLCASSPSPPSGRGGAILGYPENGPFDARPGRIGRTQTVLTDDAYGRGPVPRLLTPLRGLVRPGNSGGPLVDGDGAVLTTVFAGTVGGRQRGGYGVANATVERVLAQARARATAGQGVSTQACATG